MAGLPVCLPPIPRTKTKSQRSSDAYIRQIITSDHGLLPVRGQAIVWTNDGVLLIRPLETKFNEIQIETQQFANKEVNLKVNWKCHLQNGGLFVMASICQIK